MKNKKTINRWFGLIMAIIMMFTLTGASVIAAEPVLEVNLPTGGVNPIELISTEVTPEIEAEVPAVIAKPYDSRTRSYITPSMPGYNTYGYQWLATSPDPYVVANRAALVGLYEAFTQYSELAYYSTADISTLGPINVTALNIPTGSQSALTAANRLLHLVASVFDADNPQYYFVANGYSYSYYGGTNGTLYSVKPAVRASYNTYSARQYNNAIITNKFAEYKALADEVNTPYDKARIIHDKILAERDYAYFNGLPDNNDYAHTIMGVFDTTTNGPVCESYAKAYAYILNRLGINTIYLSGLGNGGGHAWNMVNLNGIWYYCDPTWNDRETTVSDPGNMTNDLYYMYYMRSSNNPQFFPAHQVGTPEGTNGWYMYDEPVASSTDLDANVQEFSYITDNAYYGNANWTNGGKYTVKNNYVVGYSQIFSYDRNVSHRDFGTYTLPVSGDVVVTGANLHLFKYTTYSEHLRKLILNGDFRIVVKNPVAGLNRAWVYGTGNTFRGIDFGWVTLR